MKNRFLILFISCFVFNSHTQTTWFVAVSGNDSNTGLSEVSAFATISNAIASSTCGDSIYILGGTYHEKIFASTICPENNRKIIQGDTTSRPLIIGDSLATNKYAISAGGEGFRFRHLELTSPYPNICSQAHQVIVGNGDHFDFIDVIVRDGGYDGIKVYGDCASSNFAVNWRISDCQIINNGTPCPTSILNGDGIDFTECRGCVIENSIIKNNKGHQIQIKLESYNVKIRNNYIEGVNLFQIGLPGAVAQCDLTALNADSISIHHNVIFAKGDTSDFVFKLADVSHLSIENNTIIKDSVSLIDIGFICFGGCGGSSDWMNAPSAPILIRNNIFYNNSSVPFYYGVDTSFFDPFSITASEVSMSYNLFYDSNGQYVTPPLSSSNSIVANPLFCDYPTNFELSSTSPCINSGDPSSPNDPDLSINDIGARFYQNPCNLFVEEIANDGVLFYPNPVGDFIHLKTSKIKFLKIFDNSGKLILSASINSDKISISKLVTGNYIVEVHFENGEVVRENLVKM